MTGHLSAWYASEAVERLMQPVVQTARVSKYRCDLEQGISRERSWIVGIATKPNLEQYGEQVV